MLNIKFSDKCDKDEIINMMWAWDKEKYQSPWWELNPWPPKHRAGTLFTELQELVEREAI